MQTTIKEIKVVKVYFIKGICPKNYLFPNDIKETPISGNHIVFLIDDGMKNTFRLFSPFLLAGWTITDEGCEYLSAKDIPKEPEELIPQILRRWETCRRLDLKADYVTAEEILSFLGANLPDRPSQVIKKKSRGKGKLPDFAHFKPIRKDTRRGQVAAAFLSDSFVSLEIIQRKLDLTRSGVLSHLHGAHKFHGIGYELGYDSARLILPEGISEEEIWTES